MLLDKDSTPLEITRAGLKAGGKLRSLTFYELPPQAAAELAANLDAAGFANSVGSMGGSKVITVSLPR